jgi:hypothetical protein
MQRLLYIYILIVSPAFLQAQTVSGSWFGRADVELAGIHNNYLTELVIRQRGNRVDGIFGYYFRDKYQSFFVHGRYNPKTREITILNIPVIYYASNSTVNSIDCNTNFRGTLINSKVSSSLTGAFYHDQKYKYLCPDLKVSYTLDRGDTEQDSVLTAISARARIWKPQADDFVVNEVKGAPLTVNATVKPDEIMKTADSGKMAVTDSVKTAPGVRTDTAKLMAAVAQPVDSGKTAVVTPATAVATPVVQPAAAVAPVAVAPAAMAAVMPAADPRKVDSVKIAESFSKRKAVLNRELLVESDSVRLSFYDNGEIDGDSISVFVNHELILSHQELAAKAFNIYLHLDSTRELNEISMFAENLGRLPPNTALMVVTDGVNRYEVFLSSSLTENATV